LLRSLPEARSLTTGEVHIVLNRGRRTSSGQFADLVRRHAGVLPLASLPYDRSACDLALSSGRSLTEVSVRSPLRQAIARLAEQLVTVPSPVGG
jgi:Flp pilus assembly CpaE family ATPase